MISREQLLKIAFWARDLAEGEIEPARRGIVEKTFPAGAYICHRGDRLDSWTGVIDGLVKMGTVSKSGKDVTFTGLRTGGWFGEGTILKDEPRRYDLVALRETRMALMNRAAFLWLFEQFPGGGSHLEISQEELGLLTGISRQATNKSLQVLESKGLVRVERNGITVLDLASLGHYGE